MLCKIGRWSFLKLLGPRPIVDRPLPSGPRARKINKSLSLRRKLTTLLSARGFARHTSSTTAIRGWKNHYEGFQVTDEYGSGFEETGSCKVHHFTPSNTGMSQETSEERRAHQVKMLLEYRLVTQEAGYECIMSADQTSFTVRPRDGQS